MPYLIYGLATVNEKVYDLKLGINKVGRQFDNDIVLADNSISRYHAEIEVREDVTIVRDQNSLNHTFINGVKISQFQLNDGDLVGFGHVSLQFSLTYTPKSMSIEHKTHLSKDEPIIVKKINSDQNISFFDGLISAEKADYSVIKLPHNNREQRTFGKLQILLEISKQLCSPLDPDRMLANILDLLFQVMEIDRAVILLINEQSHELESKAVKVASGINASQDFYSKKITNLVNNTGDSILTTDAITDERFNDTDSIIMSSIHASICVPLKIKNEIIGVLYVDNLSMASIYSDEDLEFLTGLANQAAAAIHMAKEFYKREQELQQQIVELKIQIDRDKKEEEVAEIIESDYFKNLQSKASKLRGSING